MRRKQLCTLISIGISASLATLAFPATAQNNNPVDFTICLSYDNAQRLSPQEQIYYFASLYYGLVPSYSANWSRWRKNFYVLLAYPGNLGTGHSLNIAGFMRGISSDEPTVDNMETEPENCHQVGKMENPPVNVWVQSYKVNNVTFAGDKYVISVEPGNSTLFTNVGFMRRRDIPFQLDIINSENELVAECRKNSKGRVICREQLPISDTAECKTAIVENKKRLEETNGVEVVHLQRDEHGYQNEPNSRPHSYRLSFAQSSQARNVINSPVLLSNITANLLSNCESVGLIQFGIEDSPSVEHLANFGLMGNGDVQKFRCQSVGAEERYIHIGTPVEEWRPDPPLSWGERYCK